MYYPKSHITPNLYSNGELYLSDKTTQYTGYYFSTIDKTYYTGRFPGDGDNLPLYKFKASNINSSPDNDDFEDMRFATIDNNLYSSLNGISPNSTTNLTPLPFYPQPTEQDYELGEFRRYFSKKVNENIYYETSGLFQNSLYIGFYVPWVVSGDKEQVYNTNKSLVELRERELSISRFGDYLKHNYLKFYKE